LYQSHEREWHLQGYTRRRFACLAQGLFAPQESPLALKNLLSLHIEQNVQECDATMYNRSNPAGPIENSNDFLYSYGIIN
jgi:hypothetical protein